MSRLRIFIDGTQYHDFDLEAVTGTSLGNAEAGVSRFTVKTKSGNYTFYSMDGNKLHKAQGDAAKARYHTPPGDAELHLELKDNPKYKQAIEEADPGAPHLKVFVGDHQVLDATIDSLIQTEFSGGKQKDSTITIHSRNPDKFVDGADVDSRDTDLKFKFIVADDELIKKSDELHEVVHGTKTGTIHFDAGLNPTYVPATAPRLKIYIGSELALDIERETATFSTSSKNQAVNPVNDFRGYSFNVIMPDKGVYHYYDTSLDKVTAAHQKAAHEEAGKDVTLFFEVEPNPKYPRA